MKTSIFLCLLSCLPLLAEPLQFSNTQTWAAKYKALSTTSSDYLSQGWQQRLMPATPPTNTSEETVKELKTLIQRQKERTQKDVANIVREIKPSGHLFLGVHPLSLESKKDKPHTYALLQLANTELAKVVFYYKRHFDRVRPSFLEPKLQTAIPNPAHPAYPSGHATQAMTFALLLAELQPEKKDRLVQQARTIGTNREIAGVHYASDSEAGYSLAQKLVAELLMNETFKALAQKAEKEWE